MRVRTVAVRVRACSPSRSLAAAPAQAALRPVKLASPASGSLVAVAPHADGVAGVVALRGRAARGAVVEVRARCALAVCSTTATADRRAAAGARS